MRETRMSQYETTDLFLASFLVASKHSSLKGITDNGYGRKTFVFEPSPSQEIILRFYNGEEKISAIKLLETLGSLKAATYTLNSKSKG
jgi:hypothetical protein